MLRRQPEHARYLRRRKRLSGDPSTVSGCRSFGVSECGSPLPLFRFRTNEYENVSCEWADLTSRFVDWLRMAEDESRLYTDCYQGCKKARSLTAPQFERETAVRPFSS